MKEKETESTIPAEQEEIRSGVAMKPKKKRRKKKLVRRLILTALLLGVLGLIIWNTVSNLQAEYRITYDPYVATTGSISNSLSFSGSMQLKNSATYTAEAGAKVRQVYVAVGDRVSKGDRLLRLSDGEVIEAEFDGTVSALEVEKDDEVKAGDTLAVVADFDHMTVSVRVGESDIGSVFVGQKCRVSVSSANLTFDATIDKIDYVSYTGNNVAYYTTTVNVDTSEAENLYPGMQATVTVPLEEAENVVVLRMDAISTGPDNTAFVYKELEDGTMESVPVTVGVSNGNYVEIREGVTDGETVYAVAEKEEELTGLAGLFSNMFSNQRVNRRNWQGGGSTPGSGNYTPPDGATGGDGNWPGRNSNDGSSRPGGGSRGN